MLTNKLKTHIIKLQQKKYRQKFDEFLIEGLKGVKEALQSEFKITTVVVEENYKEKTPIKKLIKELEDRGVALFYCNKIEGNKIKTTKTFSGILAIVKITKYLETNLINTRPIILLDAVSDPGNLGTIIRTANWFGINNILLSEDSVDLYNEKTIRSTMGSIFYTKTVVSKKIVQSIESLKEKGYTVIALTMDGEDIKKLKPTNKSIYIFGNESHSIRPEILKLIDKKYTILGSGPAESLNLGVSAGILMSKI